MWSYPKNSIFLSQMGMIFKGSNKRLVVCFHSFTKIQNYAMLLTNIGVLIMQKFLILILIFSSSLSLAQFTGTQTSTHQHEATEQQKAADRIENANREQALKPNEKSKPTTVDTSKWGIDPNVQFQITNHLLGYSTIMESEQTLTGVKITGLVNFAYYNVKKKEATTERSKARYVFGLESPLYDFTNRFHFWGGMGLTLGDARGLYVDLGLEYQILSWFKIQGGFNYNSDGGTYPQASLGFVW